jgi:hypothetical protein
MHARLGPISGPSRWLVQWFVALFLVPALAGVVLAADPEGAELPEDWKYPSTLPVEIVGGGAIVEVVSHVELSGYLFDRLRMTRSWMENSTAVAKEHRDRIETLEDEVAALRKEIEALRNQQPGGGGTPTNYDARFAAIEARLDKLEATKGTVTVPFRVVDKSGFELVLIDESAATFTIPSGGATNISLKQGTEPQIFLGNSSGGLNLEGGETSRVSMVNGDTAVFEVKQDAGQGVLMTGTTTEGGFELGSGPGLLGLVVKKADQPAAGLGTFDGRGVALRVFGTNGLVVGAMGENPAVLDTGIAYVGNGTRNAAALAVVEDGSGVVHAFAVDGTVGAGLIGADRMIAAYNAAGNAVATMGKSENSEGGNVTARDAAGDGVFRAGYNAVETGGDACVYRAKKQNTFCLGIGAPMMGVGKF